MEKITQYFGTDLNQAGHYLFDISADGESFSNYGTSRFYHLPFHPESLCQDNAEKGSVLWSYFASKSMGNFTVCCIVGSCSDKRPGSKSVFIHKGSLNYGQVKELIISTPICAQIINKFNFKVNW